MDKRILTLVVEVEQPQGNWIWDMHLKEKDGVRVTALYEGDVAKIPGDNEDDEDKQ